MLKSKSCTPYVIAFLLRSTLDEIFSHINIFGCNVPVHYYKAFGVSSAMNHTPLRRVVRSSLEYIAGKWKLYSVLN